MATKNDTAAAVHIDRVSSESLIVPIVGTTPLLMHKFSAKQKRVMLEAMQGKKSLKEVKNPTQDFIEATYFLPDAANGNKRYGFPVVGFKAATCGAARFYPKNSVTMTGLRQFLWFDGDGIDDEGNLLTEIHNTVKVTKRSPMAWPRVREDVVRVGNGGADLRYRPEFATWRADLRIRYSTSALTRGSVLSLIDAGGMGVGVGEWRPEKRGMHGTYKVDGEREVKVVRV